MIVTRVVYAVARDEVEQAPAICRKKLCARATYVAYIHLENLEKSHPLWVDVLRVEFRFRVDIIDYSRHREIAPFLAPLRDSLAHPDPDLDIGM